MVTPNHYKTLELHESASQADIKRAYHRLAKQHHPDSRLDGAGDHERITQINAAYEILGDPTARKRYDAQRDGRRTQRVSDISVHYQQRRRASKKADDDLTSWTRRVYNPIDRLIGQIMSPLQAEVRNLSADPFDDELMAAFQGYLESCRESLEKAKQTFKSIPNPSQVAQVAANLYYCLNQLEDGIEEIERFTYTYDHSYLHTGQELFRISKQLRREAKADIKAIL